MQFGSYGSGLGCGKIGADPDDQCSQFKIAGQVNFTFDIFDFQDQIR